GGKRNDGRTSEEIHVIDSECGLLSEAHGSALFTRGETQSLAVVTLGDKKLTKIRQPCGCRRSEKVLSLVSFSPSCVGEVRRLEAPSRREIGHGTLAERALEPVLPYEEEFSYTIHVESTITESNGSSRDGTPLILSDITDSEDASGDMDFKVFTLMVYRCFTTKTNDKREDIVEGYRDMNTPELQRPNKAPLNL
nr:hypothetical protein [Tanacetum cinerariifolium]